jgi:hypothetical protein
MKDNDIRGERRGIGERGVKEENLKDVNGKR